VEKQKVSELMFHSATASGSSSLLLKSAKVILSKSDRIARPHRGQIASFHTRSDDE
jgi:hypothetical protein